MKTYIAMSSKHINEDGTTETRYYVYNTVSKARHSEWKSFEQARIAALDLNRMLKRAGNDSAKDY